LGYRYSSSTYSSTYGSSSSSYSSSTYGSSIYGSSFCRVPCSSFSSKFHTVAAPAARSRQQRSAPNALRTHAEQLEAANHGATAAIKAPYDAVLEAKQAAAALKEAMATFNPQLISQFQVGTVPPSMAAATLFSPPTNSWNTYVN
jgi:hypothetical protein